MESSHILNVGGSLIKIDDKVTKQFPDSAFDALLSGRQELEIKDGVPFLDRDPIAFQKMIDFLENSYDKEYIALDPATQEELRFMCVDF